MKRLHVTEKQRNIILNAVSVLILLAMLFPLYWIVANSLKLDGEIFANPPTFFPNRITFQAYTEQLSTIARPFRNSLVIACGSMLLSLCLSTPAAYGLARYKVRGFKLFLLMFLITQMLPASLVLTPLFLTFSRAQLLNTYIAPILSTATVSVPFVVLLLRPGFLSIPLELESSAKIDGCNTFSAFVRIVIPVSKPGIITAACFGFVMSWNDLIYSMTFNVRANMRPMTAAIYQFMNQYGTQWNKIMAYGVLLIIPTCVLFVTMQKHIISGIVSGSVKG